MYDCQTCKRALSRAERSRLGCAYVAGSTGASPVRGASVEATVCPGYSVSLPVVQEVASCRAHWDKGSLSARLQEYEPTGVLMDLVEVAAGALGSCESYFMKPKDERR